MKLYLTTHKTEEGLINYAKRRLSKPEGLLPRQEIYLPNQKLKVKSEIGTLEVLTTGLGTFDSVFIGGGDGDN